MNGNGIGPDSLTRGQMNLRWAVGVLGIWFPIILIVLGCFYYGEVRLTISDYYNFVASNNSSGSPKPLYYPALRDFFVGVLFLIGLSLIYYTGYEKKINEFISDKMATTIAGVCALGVAMIPTAAPSNAIILKYINLPFISVSILHVIVATLFFLSVTYISFIVFTRTDPSEPMSPRKKRRNMIYIGCGTVMLVAIVLIGVVSVIGHWWPDLQTTLKEKCYIVLILESVSLVAFGFSWLTKAKASFLKIFGVVKG